MSEPDGRRALGDALTAVKKRSGRSFEALARRLSVSKSALHRYAAGDTAPPRIGIVRDWARACAATPTEITELERLWVAAVPPVPPSTPDTGTPGQGWTPRQRLVLTGAVAALVLLTGAGYAAGSLVARPD